MSTHMYSMNLAIYTHIYIPSISQSSITYCSSASSRCSQIFFSVYWAYRISIITVYVKIHTIMSVRWLLSNKQHNTIQYNVLIINTELRICKHTSLSATSDASIFCSNWRFATRREDISSSFFIIISCRPIIRLLLSSNLDFNSLLLISIWDNWQQSVLFFDSS